jgi:hypothetical protein
VATFSTLTSFAAAAKFIETWCKEQAVKAKNKSRSKNSKSSTFGKQVAGLSTNIRAVLARGIQLRRSLALSAEVKVDLEVNQDCVLWQTQIKDEGDYLFFLLIEIVAALSIETTLSMANIRSIFSILKFLIHAERVQLSDDQKLHASCKLEVIKAPLVHEYF